MALWTPANFGTALKLWHKADALSLNDGDPVASWTDSSGNGKHMVNATEAEQPSYETNELNSLPIVRFNGSSDDLTLTTHGLTKPYTMACVVKVVESSVTNGDRVWQFNSGNNFMAVGGSGLNDHLMAGGSTLVYGLNVLDTNTHIHVLSLAASGNSSGAIDGVATTGDAGTSALGANLTYGSNGTSLFLEMDAAEFVWVTGTVSDADIYRLEGYLAHKWGLTANLQSNHPCKSAAPRVPIPRIVASLF
jgi:hypothetical protein